MSRLLEGENMNQPDARWQNDLGNAYFRQKDYGDAVKCFAQAAEQGHPQAQCNLGICYMDGLGVGKDEAEAVKWLSKAAEQGDAHAEYSFGVAYFSGRGVSKDFPLALTWWRSAAEHGHATAQNNLGVCYEKGDGVAQDYVEAYKWMKLAAVQGYEGAQKNSEELLQKMSMEQIAALNQMVVINPAEYLRLKREQMTPKEFSDFIGQDRIKARLELAVAAAKLRGESLGHILLVGTPGSGKATLANVIAKVMGTNVKATGGSTIEKAADVAGLLTNLEEGDVLFVDEINRLQKTIEEYLQPAMKDFQLDIIIDQGPNAREVRLNLPRFTLIGSTANTGRLTPNLLSCFRIIENMDAYSIEELATIARRFATVIKVEIDTDATDRIARSADGTPIDVLNRLQHVSDFAHVNGEKIITLQIAEAALKMLASSDEKEYVSDSRDAIPSAVRREVWRRDGGKCARCGSRKNLEYDHIIPVSKGGSNTARNIELLCEEHNRAKSDLIQ
jgi:Holliday junction DNA helicase RuvB subunit